MDEIYQHSMAIVKFIACMLKTPFQLKEEGVYPKLLTLWIK